MRRAAESLVELTPKPSAPTGMSPRARAIWRSIVADRPATWFRPAAAVALRTFCETSAALEALPIDAETLKLRDALVRQQAALLARLRLCPVDEESSPRDAANKAARHHAANVTALLGGKVTKLAPRQD